MTEDEKFKLTSRVKYGFILEDPFPAHTQVEQVREYLSNKKGLLNWFRYRSARKQIDKMQSISVWSAYQAGVSAAYDRLEVALKEL